MLVQLFEGHIRACCSAGLRVARFRRTSVLILAQKRHPIAHEPVVPMTATPIGSLAGDMLVRDTGSDRIKLQGSLCYS